MVGGFTISFERCGEEYDVLPSTFGVARSCLTPDGQFGLSDDWEECRSAKYFNSEELEFDRDDISMSLGPSGSRGASPITPAALCPCLKSPKWQPGSP
jgi:hypothetical protein